jgi:plasmid stability protein
MSESELLERIQRGRVTADMLPQVFDDAYGVPEELRLKALSSLMRINPSSTRAYFQRLNPEKIAEAVEMDRVEPELVGLAVRVFPDSDRLVEAALKSPRTPTQALLLLAGRINQAQIALLLRDEGRLILAPDLIGALLAREDLDDLERQRLQELNIRIKKDAQLQIRAALHPENMSDEDRQLLIEEDPTGEDNPKESIYTKLITMTAAEKAMLALHCNRMTRMMLVRDPNPLVSRAVMRSPRLSEQDIEAFSRLREIDEDVLRQISQNRRWMRKYIIMRNLALNPRTPITIALGLVERLNNNDIRSSTRDHNLASPVKQAVLRIARKRGIK